MNQESRLADSDPNSWSKCDQRTCPLQKYQALSIILSQTISLLTSSRYTPNSVISSNMASLASRFPSLASVVKVGASALGQNITGIRISRGVNSGLNLLILSSMRIFLV